MSISEKETLTHRNPSGETVEYSVTYEFYGVSNTRQREVAIKDRRPQIAQNASISQGLNIIVSGGGSKCKKTDILIEACAKIGKNVTLRGPVKICAFAKVGNNVTIGNGTGAVVGQLSVLGNGVTLCGKLGEKGTIGEGSLVEISSSDIGKNAIIGEGVVIRSDHFARSRIGSNFFIGDNSTFHLHFEVGNNVTIGSRCRLGNTLDQTRCNGYITEELCVLLPGNDVTIGDDAYVEAGTTLGDGVVIPTNGHVLGNRVLTSESTVTVVGDVSITVNGGETDILGELSQDAISLLGQFAQTIDDVKNQFGQRMKTAEGRVRASEERVARLTDKVAALEGELEDFADKLNSKNKFWEEDHDSA